MHQPARPIPLRGSLRLRVRYCECDPMGYVHHASYLPWLEMGRTELLRDAGMTYRAMEDAGIFLVIVKLDCRFRRPSRYDDLIEVRTTVVGGGRVKIQHEYEVVRVPDPSTQSAHAHDADSLTTGSHAPAEEVLMTASSTLACVDAHGKVRELPEWLILKPARIH